LVTFVTTVSLDPRDSFLTPGRMAEAAQTV